MECYVSGMQKSNDHVIRKMPLPIDIDVVEGTIISDGIQTLGSKETSHIRILSMDSDGFFLYEISPPKKTTSKSLKDYLGQDQILGKPETTVAESDGTPISQYRYFKRTDGSYYVSIVGKNEENQHRIELGKLTDRNSSIYLIAKAIAFNFDVKQFSRNDLEPFFGKQSAQRQKCKALLEVLHREGYLVKEIDKSSRNKIKELYSATEKLKKVVLPSPNPEQA